MIEISIIVPVLNEQEQINPLIQHLEPFAQRHSIEVIIVDGDRHTSTINAITYEPSWLVTTSSPPGRGIQMNKGARIARGDILLFLHADTSLPRHGLKNILDLLKNADIQGGAHDLHIQTANPVLSWIGNVASWRSRFTRIPYGDQVIFVRKTVFQALGGYPDIPIMEDVAFMKKLKKRQAHIHILKAPVSISDRRWKKEGVLYTTLRNWLLLTLYEIGVSPHQLAKWYKPNQPQLQAAPQRIPHQ